MIYVTQGHEKSIGLEVFLKSFLLLKKSEQNNFTLICNKNTLKKYLNLLKIKNSFDKSFVKIENGNLNCYFTNKTEYSESLESLLTGIKLTQEGHRQNLLVTLPTTKDQLKYKKNNFLGHTEFFRHYFKNNFLPMLFFNERLSMLLLTDHCSLNSVSRKIKKKFIVEKIKIILDTPLSNDNNYNEVLFSGINPHAGENGLLGKEDCEIKFAIKILNKLYPKINFKGPFAADSMFGLLSNSKKQLLVYAYHDQGLCLFKGYSSYMGINITLGLPFLRLSVDHGTAFHLYGKNSANYNGCFYVLKKSLEFSRGLL